jgi:hypothetical protein
MSAQQWWEFRGFPGNGVVPTEHAENTEVSSRAVDPAIRLTTDEH